MAYGMPDGESPNIDPRFYKSGDGPGDWDRIITQWQKEDDMENNNMKWDGALVYVATLAFIFGLVWLLT